MKFSQSMERRFQLVCRTVKVMLGVFAALLVSASLSFAVDYGQIKGQVIDKKSKEPMPGVSISLVGTSLGAISDEEGKYVIRNVPPGEHKLKVSSIGYAEMEFTEVRVFTGLTFEQNITMEIQAADIGEKIVVTSDRQIIDKFEVASTHKLHKEEILRKPVTNVNDLVKTIAGVKLNNEGQVFIRGGRAGEIAYYVDGVNIRDPVSGSQSFSNISLTSGSAQEVQVIKDGFDPEYGNALSGVIKITSQKGNPDRTSLVMQFITDDFGNSSLNKFSRNYDYLRFSLSGPDPLFTTKILPALGINFLKDKEFTYYFYADVQKTNGSYNAFDYVDGPNNRLLDNLNVFGFDVPERLINNYSLNTNISFKPERNLHFTILYQASVNRFSSFNNSLWQYRFTPGTTTQSDNGRQLGALKMSHNISKDFQYEIIFSYKKNKVEFGPGDPANPGKVMTPDQFLLQDQWESYEDLDNNGVYTPPEPIINVFPDTFSYGNGLAGPQYTFSEFGGYFDTQCGCYVGNIDNSPLGWLIGDFQFNDNGGTDSLEGETFADLNGNGIWDRGDPFKDTNGNGIFDPSRADLINNDVPEPYHDGDINLGEPFTDVNGNGIYDPGIDIFVLSDGPENQDLNRNSRYDDANPDNWTTGVPFIDVNGNGVYDFPNRVYDPGEAFTDLNGNGRYDGKDDFLDFNNYDDEIRWHKHVVTTKGVEIKFTRVKGSHEFRGGAEVHKDDFDYQDIKRPYQFYTGRPDGGVYPDRGSGREFFSYSPWQGSVYFRDKMEYGQMIASLGVRWDYWLQSDGLLEVALADATNTGDIIGDRHTFSPRIGFSYPISDMAKVFFNYGHFYQLPDYDFLYARPTTSADRNDVIGNYNLDFEKTIQYSFGVQYKLSDDYALRISGYYKDEFDKVEQGDVIVGALRIRQYQNRAYARGRGFELGIDKRGGIINGQINYTYAFAFGKESQTNQNYISDAAISQQSLNETPIDIDVRHAANIALQVVVPRNMDASLFGIPIFNEWTLSIEGQLETGRPYTPAREFPNLFLPPGQQPDDNSFRLPGRLEFDIRFEKTFRVTGITYNAIMWVENIFDNKYVRGVHTNTGLAYTARNPSGQVLGGTEFDRTPFYYAAGREIRVGLQMQL
ncbi:MAG: TonB-dependent receptor [candidate division Zixibacteria bacterium]|nr:TonB-dependent receptor [candidate division Zixibacteria bacterium]